MKIQKDDPVRRTYEIKATQLRVNVQVLWTQRSFVGLTAVKAAALASVCQVCHSTEVVFKAGVQTNISTPLSSPMEPLWKMNIENTVNVAAFTHPRREQLVMLSSVHYLDVPGLRSHWWPWLKIKYICWNVKCVQYLIAWRKSHKTSLATHPCPTCFRTCLKTHV